MARIKSINVWQAAKVVGLLYLVLFTLIILPLTILPALFSPNSRAAAGGVLLMLATPLLYGIFSFFGTALACALYNRISEWIGGIEVELEADHPADDAVQQ